MTKPILPSSLPHRLTIKQSHKFENIQKTSREIILNNIYIDYPACEITGLKTLAERRKARLVLYERSVYTLQKTQYFPH